MQTSSPGLPSRIPSPGTSSSNVQGSFWVLLAFVVFVAKFPLSQLTYLCVGQDGVNIIVGHGVTLNCSCLVLLKVHFQARGCVTRGHVLNQTIILIKSHPVG